MLGALLLRPAQTLSVQHSMGHILWTIPLSYYLINAPYNTFILVEGTSQVTITITAGNYSALSFATVVTQLLNSSSPHGYTYTITLNNSYATVNTGLFYYTVSGNSGVQPSFVFGQRVCQQMGFAENSTATFIANALVSTNVLNFIPSTALFLHSDMVDDETDILQELYSDNTVPYSNHVYNCQNVDMYSKKLRSRNDNIFFFALEDEHGVVINLNGQSILLTLLLYKKDDFNAVFKKYVKCSIMKNDDENNQDIKHENITNE